MSDEPEDSPKPQPQADPGPDEGPGGPDAVERDPDDFPLVTPDQPRSAQVDDQDMPDAIEEGESAEEDAGDDDPSTSTGSTEGAPA